MFQVFPPTTSGNCLRISITQTGHSVVGDGQTMLHSLSTQHGPAALSLAVGPPFRTECHGHGVVSRCWFLSLGVLEHFGYPAQRRPNDSESAMNTNDSITAHCLLALLVGLLFTLEHGPASGGARAPRPQLTCHSKQYGRGHKSSVQVSFTFTGQGQSQ